MADATLLFYGAPASSSGRTHLMLEECSVPYTYHRVNFRDADSKAAFLEINPRGTVPFLIDGDVRLFESIAINFYLAEAYAPQLWSESRAERAQIYAWSIWAISDLQPETMKVAYHTMLYPAERRHAAEAEHGKLKVNVLLADLERDLPPSGYLIGDRVTVADLNVASVVNLCTAFGIGTVGARTQAWLAGLKQRPSWQRVAANG